MISKEVIEKAKNCTTKEELQELAKSENIELSDADINSFLASSDTNLRKIYDSKKLKKLVDEIEK